MYKLLIADDERKIREGLALLFPWSQFDMEVVGQCSNGQEVIEFLEDNEVDIVLLDIVMPKMTGIEVSKYIHENRLGIKVVLLSAFREFEYAQESLRYQVKDYVVKPTKYEELVRVFTRLKRELDEQARAALDMNVPEESGIVERIKRYIEEHYATACLDSIADELNLNVFYISRAFKRKTGMNIFPYLTQVRMSKACEYLQLPDIKIYEVCSLVGYTEPRSFSRAFKKQFGITPTEFRASFGLG